MSGLKTMNYIYFVSKKSQLCLQLQACFWRQILKSSFFKKFGDTFFWRHFQTFISNRMFSLGQVIFTSPGFFKTPMNSPVYSDWAYFHQLHALMEVIGRKHGRQTICHSVIPYSKQSACPLQPMNSLDSPEHSNPLREFLSYLSPTACSDVWSPDKDIITPTISENIGYGH